MAKQLIQSDIGMDLTMKGRNIDLVFSVCRIKQFTDTTECMGDEIIVFVNKIVKIIHECTKKWEGKPTKNYGEKFLLTWRLPKMEDAIDVVKAEMDEENDPDEDKEDKEDLPKQKGKRGKNSAKVVPDKKKQDDDIEESGQNLLNGMEKGDE